MSKKWGFLVVIAALAGCGDDDDQVGEELEITADLDGTEGWENLDGTASARWIQGTSGFTSTIELEGDEPGQIRPWHVHFGTCGSGGDIVGSDGDYPRLEIGEDGTGTVTVTVAERLNQGEDYHVNVHLSEEEMETIIACGDLEETEEVIDL